MLSRRPVRSFVLRQGRITPAQRSACNRLSTHFCLPYQGNEVDLDAVFKRSAPRILEIGFGMGETTAQIAHAHPERDYLGVEVHTPGVGSLLQRIESLGLANVRIIQHDATEVLEHMIGEATLDGVHIFFPDPWPKKRHHKRRLIQEPFVRLLAQRLKPGGYVYMATDWQDYAQHIQAVMRTQPGLRPVTVPSPAYSRPPTKFEQRGLRQGHAIWEGVYVRNNL